MAVFLRAVTVGVSLAHIDVDREKNRCVCPVLSYWSCEAREQKRMRLLLIDDPPSSQLLHLAILCLALIQRHT